MEIKISRHMKMERAGRYGYIATTVGVGQVVRTVERINSNSGKLCKVQVTDTGVVMVRGNDDTIMTMYLANIQEIEKYFDGAVPFVLAAIVQMNMRKGHISRQNDFD